MVGFENYQSHRMGSFGKSENQNQGAVRNPEKNGDYGMKTLVLYFLGTAVVMGLYVFNLGRLYWYIGQEVGRAISL